MPSNKKLLILPGDGIGPEVMREVRRVIDWMGRRRAVSFDIDREAVLLQILGGEIGETFVVFDQKDARTHGR